MLNLVIRDNNPSKVERTTRDICVLSFITEIEAGEMYRIWEETGRKPGDFEIFRTKSPELKEAYDKMKGVKNKPDFINVYTRVSDVIETLGL